MIIKDLKLKNFRNYSELKIELSKYFNFFIGDNGTGKTNILEAISILSNIKSFKNISYINLIKWGENSFFCETNVRNGENEKYSIGCAKENNKLKKKFKIDNIKIDRIIDYYGKLLTIIYSPNDLIYINGTPEIKRKYFDGIICKIDSNYFESLYELKKIIINRNIILKKLKNNKIKNYSLLDTWDELFIKRSFFISQKRLEFINEFLPIFYKEHKIISKNEKMIPDIIFNSSLKGNSIDNYYNEFLKNRDKDIFYGVTGLGPHKDQYLFFINKMNYKNIASQGQKRLTAFALKNSEKEYIEKKTEKKCILLIDDIITELDEFNRNKILERVKNRNQVLFTLVSKELLNIDNSISKIFKVNNGFINNK